MEYIPDNFDLAERHLREAAAAEERWLATRPLCSECDEPITDDSCFEINGELICEDCMDENHKKAVDDYAF